MRDYVYKRMAEAGVLFLALMCASVLWPLAATAQEPRENLTKNPGFEEVDEAKQVPKDWVVSTWSVKKGQRMATVELSDDAHTGKVAAKIRWFEGSTNVVYGSTLTKSVQGKKKFRLTFYYKGPSATAVYASMLTASPTNKQLDYRHSKRGRAQQEWTQRVFDFTTSPETTKLSIYLRVTGDGVLFDDVSLVEIAAD